MDTLASAPRLYLLKSEPVKIAHQAGYALYNGRWHKVHQNKLAPKGAPLAAHPHAAGQHAPVKHFNDEQWEALKLPADNVNAGTFNKQLKQLQEWSDAGDVTAIVGAGFGVNTYGKKLATIANHLLGLHGSPHKVAAGQKPGWHAAVEHAPAEDGPLNNEGTIAAQAETVEAPAPAIDATPEPTPEPTSAPSGNDVPLPHFDPNYKATPFYQKVATKLKELADAGDIEGLKAANDGSAAWQGKSKNSETLLHFHLELLDAVSGAPAAGDPAPAPAPEALEPVAPAPAAEQPAPAAPDPTPATSPIPWDKLVLPDTNSNAATVNKKVAAIKAAFESGDVAAMEAIQFGKNTYNMKLAKVAQAAIALMKEGATAAPATAPAEVSAPAVEQPPAAEQPVEPAGPKDGDTKPGANGGTLVFKDGHWHLQAEPDAGGIPAPPDFASMLLGGSKQWAERYAKVAAALHLKVQSEGAAAFKGVVVTHGDGKFTITLAGFKLKKVGQDDSTQYRKEMHAYVSSLKAATGKPPKKKTVKAPAPAAAPAPAPAASTIPSMDDWEQIGPQGGSNPGGKFKAPDGTEYYCKFPENEDIAKSEVLAAKLYAAAGLAGQDAHLVTKGGKVGIASKWVEVKKGKTTAALAKAPDAQGGFAVDAWLANWDVVGLGYDNLQIGADGKAVRVDAGGSLEYRAQGSKKPFGNHVDEIDTLRDSVKNPQAAAVFGKMTQADIAASVAKVAAVSDTDIKSLVAQFGPGDAAAKKALAATLIARKADLLAKYPKAALAVAKGSSWVRLKPGERIVEAGEKFGVQWAKIKVPAKGFHASSIATPPNFFMNGSQGPTNTWKSSVKHVNEANNEAGQAIYDAAIQHKAPEPVQGLMFDQIDKATGQKTGQQLPYAQHPAGEIKEYFKQVTSELEAQTQATYKTVQNGSFTQSYSTAAMSMAADFTPVDYAAFKAHAAKAADYLVLSKSAAAGLPVPDDGAFEEQWENVSPKLIEFKKACSAKFQGLTSSEQTACKAYTGSSYANWNQALRSGDTSSNAYQSAQAMVKGFQKAAMDIPEGTILWRGIGVGEDTYKAVTGAVIQDGSFQSSSFGSSPAFSGHKTWLKIHVGKGVKGLHATSFSNFGSAEREIIIKNNVRYAVLSVTHHKNFVDSKGNSHGAKTIVDLLALPHEG